jgi:hypothetical protein
MLTGLEALANVPFSQRAKKSSYLSEPAYLTSFEFQTLPFMKRLTRFER